MDSTVMTIMTEVSTEVPIIMEITIEIIIIGAE